MSYNFKELLMEDQKLQKLENTISSMNSRLNDLDHRFSYHVHRADSQCVDLEKKEMEVNLQKFQSKTQLIAIIVVSLSVAVVAIAIAQCYTKTSLPTLLQSRNY